jgi:hypothetical protein
MRFTIQVLLLVVVFVAGAWAATQSRGVQPVPPSVLSGADIGFRMEGRKGSTAVGRLVVKVDGNWVDAEFAPRMKLVTK